MKKNIVAPPAQYHINSEGPRYDYSVMAVKKKWKDKGAKYKQWSFNKSEYGLS